MKKVIISIISCMLIFALIYSFVNYNGNENNNIINPEIVASKEANYSVSTSNYLATEVGKNILENGGNAVDAAIAISYTLGVVQPYGSGIGGGGAMVIYNPKDNSYKFFNYYASAPVSYSSKKSSIGVPGLVAGMQKIHDEYGTVEMSKLIDPSIKYAENGFEVYDELDLMIKSYKDYLKQDKNYLKNGNLLVKGDTLYQPELAETLKIIQTEGSNSFYSGSIANNIASNSYLTLKDLASYKVDEQEPVYGKFLGYDVISSPAPFGGITLIQMLKMFELTNIESPSNDSSKYLETLNSISNIAIADRVLTVADTNFEKVDSNLLTSTDYIKTLLKNNYMEYEDDEESETTTAFSVIDSNGMIVSCTNTVGSFWGAHDTVNGIVLNACLNNFSNNSASINSYKAGKKPRTYICPTILRKDNETISIGTPGGAKITKILSQILLDNIKFETDMQTAINKNRAVFLSNNVLALEKNADRENFVNVSNSKYSILYKSSTWYFGAVQVAGYSNKLGYFGATDPRRQGSVLVK
ncbi:MAG: gamma-glutamyltransferase [Clostridia bacterium]|nr:gamma-glutamyltransferase [Clostridia bacterium]